MNRSISDRYQTGAGMFAWILHRMSGLILTIYMLAYIYTLRGAQALTPGNPAGSAGLNATLATFNTTGWKIFHLVIVLSALYHTLNGVRVLLFTTSWACANQRALFWLSFGVALAIFLFAAVVMFAGGSAVAATQ